MSDQVMSLTGQSRAVHDAVNADLSMGSQGSEALMQALDCVSQADLAERYRAALWRINRARQARTRQATEAFEAAEQHAENTNDRSWSR